MDDHLPDPKQRAANALQVEQSRLEQVHMDEFDGQMFCVVDGPDTIGGTVAVVDSDGTVTSYPPLPPDLIAAQHDARKRPQ